MKVPTFYAIISTLWWSTITCAVIPASELHFLTDHLSDLLTSDTLDRPLKTKKLHQVHEIERDYGDRAWDDWMDGKGGWLSDQSHKKRKSRTNKNLSLEKKLRFGDVDDEKEFRRKKLGRYEIEEGEKFRQAADRGRGKERKWTWEAADDEDEDRNANKKPGEMNRRKHRIHEYHQKRRKNFNHLYRQHRDFNHHDDKKDQNNQRFDRKGDYYRRIHQKIWGDSDEARPARRGRVRKNKHNIHYHRGENVHHSNTNHHRHHHNRDDDDDDKDERAKRKEIKIRRNEKEDEDDRGWK